MLPPASHPSASHIGYNGPSRSQQAADQTDERPNRSTAAASPSLILLREDIADIAMLTLNRPQARNSLSEATLEALGDALTAIAHERTVRVVVLAANGPAFSAGHDLKELNAHRTDADRGAPISSTSWECAAP